jgi:hypothetical protein
MPAAALIAAIDRAVDSGCLDPETVLIDARHDMAPLAPIAAIGALARYDRPPPHAGRLRRHTHRKRLMTTTASATTVDAAAQASIGAAARELHLPTVRTEATRLARSPTGNATPTCATSPKSWPPRSTTVSNGAAPGASTMPSSPD